MIVRSYSLFITSMSSVIYIPIRSKLFPLFSHYIPIKNNIKTITRELKSYKKGNYIPKIKKMIYDFFKVISEILECQKV